MVVVFVAFATGQDSTDNFEFEGPCAYPNALRMSVVVVVVVVVVGVVVVAFGLSNSSNYSSNNRNNNDIDTNKNLYKHANAMIKGNKSS